MSGWPLGMRKSNDYESLLHRSQAVHLQNLKEEAEFVFPTRLRAAFRWRETVPKCRHRCDPEKAMRTKTLILTLIIFVMGVSTVAAKTRLEKFMEAAAKGDRGAIEKFLEKGMDVNAKNSYDKTALMFAAYEGQSEIVAFLIEKGADVKIKRSDGSTVLMNAALSGNLETVQLIVQHGADINAVSEEFFGGTPLINAAISGNSKIVTFLIDNGADPLIRTERYTSLMGAASGGSTDIARKLIEMGSDINATGGIGFTAMILAARQGHTEFVKLLVEQGADVTLALSTGETALHRAAQNGKLEMAKILVENGADVNASYETGRSILMEAAGGGHLEIVTLLIENGADVNSKTEGGHTALMDAVSKGQGHVEVVKTLLRYGADVNATRYEEETALSMAREKLDGEEIVSILLEAGAEGPPEVVDSLSAVERAAIIVSTISSIESGDYTVKRPKPVDLQRAAERLTEHLESNPDDVRALILFARIGRTVSIATPHVFSKDSAMTVSGDEYSPLLAALDRALALQPDNAEAYYWKARLFGVRLPDLSSGRMNYRYLNHDGAIAMARRAVELKPDKVAYREALALYLLGKQEFKEAMTTLADVADGKHPIYLLLKDQEAVPLPDNAIYLPEDSESLADMFMQGQQYAFLRIHSYVFPMSANEVETFYSNHWKSFKLFQFDTDQTGKFSAYLKEIDGKLSPGKSPPMSDKRPDEGIELLVFEQSGGSPEDRLETPIGHPLPSDLADVYCYLMIINYRSFK